MAVNILIKYSINKMLFFFTIISFLTIQSLLEDQGQETFDQMRLPNSLKESSYKSVLSETAEQFSKASYDQELKLKQIGNYLYLI